MKKPNLFEFATKELSQDAFFCYLLSYAKEEYKNLYPCEYQLAERVLSKILDECFKNEEIPKIETLEIRKQYYGIDILLIINEDLNNKKGYYIIIEDKTDTKEHSNQMDRYTKKIKEIKKVENNQIKTLYLKTGDESYKQLGNSEFKKNRIMREEILKFYYDVNSSVLYRGNNNIIHEYFDKLKETEKEVEEYKNIDLIKSEGIFTWNQTIGFYKELDKFFYNYDAKKDFYKEGKDLVCDYDYVSNPNGGFLCYDFYSALDFEKTSYYLQIESVSVRNGEEGGKKSKWTKEQVPYSKMTLVIKVYSRNKNINILYRALELLKSKEELKEKFDKGKFLKPNKFSSGNFMTLLLINDYISLNKNNTINVNKTASNIIKYLELLKSLANDFKDLENKD